MSSNPYGQFMGVPMNGDDIDALLYEQGYGVVSLCRDGVPYSIPLSFGYDGERVFFAMLEDSPDPTKLRFAEEGAVARLLVTAIRGRFDWRSVAVTGPLRPVDRGSDDWEHLVDTLDENGWFMRSFERAEGVSELHGWALRPDEIRGIERKEEVYE